MIAVLRALGLIACMGMLAACHTLPTQAYNRAEANVQTFGLAAPGLPQQAAVRIVTPVGANFGLVGALIEESRAASASRELEDIFAQRSYDFRKAVSESLSHSFIDIALNVKPAAEGRSVDEQGKFLKKCPVAVGAEACLDVFLTYVGYMAAGATTDYVPTVHLTARLIRNSDGMMLFQDQIQYNPLANSKAIAIQPSDKYRFKDRDAMKSDPKSVVMGIDEAIRAVTDELARQFM